MEAQSDHDIYSYERFTRHDFYTVVNRALVAEVVRRLPTGPADRGRTIVDLGCGTGAITEMLVEALGQHGLEAAIIGVEPSSSALAEAERRLAGSGADIRFVQGDGADLAGLGTTVDAVLFCNAIHLVDDPDCTVREVADVLSPGGLFAFNSAFSSDAYVPGTESFYRLWTVRAMRWLRSEHPEVRISRGGAAVTRRWRSREEYEAVLREHGFDLLHGALDEVQMTLASFQDIGRYWLFIEGALPGAPLGLGAEALRRGAAEAFDELGLTSVPRNWLQVLARRGPISAAS